MLLAFIKLAFSFSIRSSLYADLLEDDVHVPNEITYHQIRESQKLEFVNSLFQKCISLGILFGFATGGAICSYDCITIINSCNFSENIANYASCVCCFGGNMTIVHSSFTNSKALDDVGAVWSMTSSSSIEESVLNISYTKFCNNIAGRYHGALASNLTNPNIFNCEFSNNRARKAVGACSIIISNDVNIEETLFINNTSEGNFSDMSCPCLFLQSNSESTEQTINLTNCFFSKNIGSDNTTHAIATHGILHVKISECTCFDGNPQSFCETSSQKIIDFDLVYFNVNQLERCYCLFPSPSAPYTNSDIFTPTVDFTYSSFFTESSKFSPSEIFTGLFSASIVFSESSDFSISQIFSKSSDFSISQIFSKSSDFSISQVFSKSSDFSISQVFSKSSDFSKSQIFPKSSDFSISQIFSKSSDFSKSQIFSKSSDFSASQEFSKSKDFTGSNIFTESATITITPSPPDCTDDSQSTFDKSFLANSEQSDSENEPSDSQSSDSKSEEESSQSHSASPEESKDQKKDPDLNMGALGGGLGLLLLIILLIIIICCCCRKKKKGGGGCGCCSKTKKKEVIKEKIKEPIMISIPHVDEYDDGFINYINPEYNDELLAKA